RRHTRFDCDWIQTCALPIFALEVVGAVSHEAGMGCVGAGGNLTLRHLLDVRQQRRQRAGGNALNPPGLAEGDWSRLRQLLADLEIGRASCRERGWVRVGAAP